MRILVAEDDRITRRRLEVTLTKWGYEVVVASDGAEAWETLQSDDAPQLAILDWMMPAMDGLEVCQELRRQRAEPYVYVILLTARGQRADLVQGMEAGADDYVVKPFDPHELKVRLRAGTRIVELQTELIAAREALRIQATHDPLTGVWNRAAIMEALGRELARAAREDGLVAVVMADLDHFKRINDTYGHLAGDEVLKEAIHRVCSSLRPYDLIGRYGGEEFLIVLTGDSALSAANIAERVRECVAGKPVRVAESNIRVTVSLGLATAEMPGPVWAESLVRAADTALYRAKAAGRNRVAVAEQPDTNIMSQSTSTAMSIAI